MRKNLARSVVTLVVAGVCLVATAVPAAAATTSMTIVSGTLILAKTGQTTRFVALGGNTTGTGCRNSFLIDTTSTTSTPGTFNITSPISPQQFYVGRTQLFGATGLWYIIELTRLGSFAATNSNYTTGTASGSSITVNIQFWTATDQSDTATSCTHGTSTADSGTTPSDRRANWTTTISNIAVSNYTAAGGGSIINPAVSDAAQMDSTASTQLIGTSAVPFAAYSLGNVTLDDLIIHAIA